MTNDEPQVIWRMRILVLISIVTASSFVHAEDWPEFRGPTGQGQTPATGLPADWSPSVNRNVLWKMAVPGIGWSSPVVVVDRIYLTTAVPVGGQEKPDADRSLRVISLNAKDGQVIWDKEVFLERAAEAPRIHRKNSHATPTPIVRDGRVYVHFGHQGSAALDASNGAVVWQTREFAYKPVHGAGGSPVIVDDLFIFNADAEADPAVIALDKNTGKLRWKFTRVSESVKKFSFCTPLLIEVNGQRQLITPGSGVVNALDPATGQEIWKVRYGQGYSIVPRPVFAHGLVFISTGFDKPIAMAIRPDGKGDVTDTHVAWTIDKFAPHSASMVVVGDEFYMVADNGVLTCADAKTGKVYYQERCTGPISASILYADDKLFLLDEKGLGVVVKPGKTFRVLAKNDLAERALASYAVLDNGLLIRTESHLWRIGKR